MTIADASVNPVLDLGIDQLQPIAETASGDAVADLHVAALDLGLNEYARRKFAIKFDCRTREGKNTSLRAIAKWLTPEQRCEAEHYRRLQTLNAPVPRLYGIIPGPDGEDLLFLELLDTVVPDHSSDSFSRFMAEEANVRDLLTAMARFNTIAPKTGYLRRIRSEDVAARLHSIASSALDRTAELEPDLSGDIAELRAFAERLGRSVGEFQRGLIHCDLYAGNLGWRSGTRELLIFDLEGTAVGPRFYDVALLLGDPSGRELCRPRIELAEHFLSQYAHHGGDAPEMGAFLGVLDLLWWARQFYIIEPWLNGLLRQEEPQAEYLAAFLKHLQLLIRGARESGSS